MDLLNIIFSGKINLYGEFLPLHSNQGIRSVCMLVLTRRIDESIAIGDNIQITVLAVEGERVKLGISAPRDVVILRQEIYQAVKEQSKIQEHLAQEPESKGIEDLRKFLAEEVIEEDSTDSAEKKE